jgi:hypothetical protein
MQPTASPARSAPLSAAAAALDAELARAAVDERLALILRACAHGGATALAAFCDAVEDPARQQAREPPALALLDAVRDPEAAERAVRAAAWAMAAQRLSSAWPSSFHAKLQAARAVMALSDRSFEHMQPLGSLTACASTTTELDTRDGQRMQFSRESLEHVIAAATGTRPGRRDMLLAIAPWTTCFMRGIKACDAHLRELERRPTIPLLPDPADG